MLFIIVLLDDKNRKKTEFKAQIYCITNNGIFIKIQQFFDKTFEIT